MSTDRSAILTRVAHPEVFKVPVFSDKVVQKLLGLNATATTLSGLPRHEMTSANVALGPLDFGFADTTIIL